MQTVETNGKKVNNIATLKMQYVEKGIDIDYNGVVRKLKTIYNASGKTKEQMTQIVLLEARQFQIQNPHFDYRAPSKFDNGSNGSVNVIMEFIFNPNKVI